MNQTWPLGPCTISNSDEPPMQLRPTRKWTVKNMAND